MQDARKVLDNDITEEVKLLLFLQVSCCVSVRRQGTTGKPAPYYSPVLLMRRVIHVSSVVCPLV